MLLRCVVTPLPLLLLPLAKLLFLLLLLSPVRLFVTPWTRARQALLPSTASRSWVKFMLVASITLAVHLVLCRPLLLLPSHFPNIRVFPFSSHEAGKVLEPQLQDLSFQ